MCIDLSVHLFPFDLPFFELANWLDTVLVVGGLVDIFVSMRLRHQR